MRSPSPTTCRLKFGFRPVWARCGLILAMLAGFSAPARGQERVSTWSVPVRAAPQVTLPEPPAPPQQPVLRERIAPETVQHITITAAEPEQVRPINDRLKPIGEVRTGIKPREATYPVDYAAAKFAEADVQASEIIVQRLWASNVHSWDATAFCHRPLYFEDENLERHGRSFGVLQPAVSAGHFASRFIAWPYLAGATPPHRCVYNLGRAPPGTYTPYTLARPPLSLRGAALQAGAVIAVPLIVP